MEIMIMIPWSFSKTELTNNIWLNAPEIWIQL